MSIVATFNSNLQVLETLTSTSTPTASAPIVTHDGMNEAITLNAGSSPVVTTLAASVYLLSGTTGSLDLTAIASTNGATVTGSGLKVHLCKLRAIKLAGVANTGALTVKFGASNPYNLLGASWVIVLQPGQTLNVNLNGAAGAIGSGAKSIDLSGTSGDGLEYEFVMGT